LTDPKFTLKKLLMKETNLIYQHSYYLWILSRHIAESKGYILWDILKCYNMLLKLINAIVILCNESILVTDYTARKKKFKPLDG
jgi:hypothetical protein